MSFDRGLVKYYRDRATVVSSYLFSEVGSLISERLPILLPTACNSMLVVGRDLSISVEASGILPGHVPIFHADISSKFSVVDGRKHFVVADHELLPFRKASIDFIVSSLTLHNVNDIYSVFHSLHSILKPQGSLLAVTYGSGTLREIKKALIVAEGDCVVPRIQPFLSSQEMLSVFHSCGFRDIVVDVSNVEIGYESLYHLFKDLKNMGEGNALGKARSPLNRGLMSRAWEVYKQSLGRANDSIVPVSFEIIILKGSRGVT